MKYSDKVCGYVYLFCAECFVRRNCQSARMNYLDTYNSRNKLQNYKTSRECK